MHVMFSAIGARGIVRTITESEVTAIRLLCKTEFDRSRYDKALAHMCKPDNWFRLYGIKSMLRLGRLLSK